ncbi:MAG: hypothetical protein AAB213_00760, partial [Candidatus Omnitrophota bacterium]
PSTSLGMVSEKSNHCGLGLARFARHCVGHFACPNSLQTFAKKFLIVGLKNLPFFLRYSIIFGILLFVFAQNVWAASGKQPITVNGDTVEFKSEGREVIAEGHVEILNEDTTLTCDKVRVFIDQKLAIAEGHVRFSKAGGEELSGEMFVFDFDSRTGTIMGPEVWFPPYYGKSEIMEKLSDTEFLLTNGEMSTCDLPHPHYNLKCAQAKMEPGRVLTAKGVKMSILGVPLMYVPTITQRLTDKKPRFMITPGSRKGLGTYFLGSWRYYLNQNAKGVLHLDWYQKRGWAEGVDLNYDTKSIGLGNVRYFRIDEKNMSNDNPVPEPERRMQERSRIEVRHKWDITPADHFVFEYFRQSDLNVRKDFFYREYEKVTNPRTFLQFSHVYPNATLSFLAEPRVNKFDSVLQRIPELKLETVNQKIGQTPFYYKNTSQTAYLSSATANVGPTNDLFRTDTSNQLSYLFRFMSVDFSPFVGHRDTYYSRGLTSQEDLLRGMFFGGMDMSTKFYKIYNVQTDYLGLGIDKLRHVVTPSLQYRYQHMPTVNRTKLLQLDGIDSLDKQDMVTFGLDNKLQTRRDGAVVDLATLILTSDYNIERSSTAGNGFQNLKYRLELKPYSMWEFDSQAEYDTVGDFFKTVTSDVWAHTGKASATVGYRYKRNESSQLTTGFTCPLNPFWKVNIYERFEFRTGNLVEQEYTLDRDLHCWTVQFIINQRKAEGISFFIAFKLKAFPDIGINAQKSFSPPRTNQ